MSRIAPTIGPLTIDTVITNIEQLILTPCSELKEPPPLRGVAIMQDETKLKPKPMFFKEFNSIGGFCCLHTKAAQVVLSSFTAGLAILNNVQQGRFHYGKELNNIVTTCFGEHRIYPLALAPTCKQETAEDIIKVYSDLEQAWRESGAELQVGSIWSWPTDGNAIQRAAKHLFLVKYRLSETSPIYWLLVGLNTLVGDYDMMDDYDPKHCLKHESQKLVFDIC